MTDKDKVRRDKAAKADEPEKEVPASDEETETPGKTKKKTPGWMYLAGGAGALLILVIWWGMQPLRGSVHYGICKTFVETQLAYPSTLSVSSYDQFGPAVRIYLNYFDPFGEYKQTLVRCVFQKDENTGQITLLLDKVKIGRIDVDQEKLWAFNETVPTILQYEMDLSVPRPPGEDIEDLKTN
ncbi:MAG: hypothetical protein H6868_02610 [Rhodospirillales bacterium]|nr:hypothetical protein [Rhodospirillales bacterium]